MKNIILKSCLLSVVFCVATVAFGQNVRYNITTPEPINVTMISSMVMHPVHITNDNPMTVIRAATTEDQLQPGNAGRNFSLNNELGGNRGDKVRALVYADCDDDMSTFQSSAAYLDFGADMACTTVKKAFLYWAGARGSAINYAAYPGIPTMKSYAGTGTATSSLTGHNQVKFKAPGDAAYSTVTANAFVLGQTTGDNYVCVADVTTLVQGKPGGLYWVADVRSQTNTTSAVSGWSLVVIYEPPNCPPRVFTLWDGAIGEGDETNRLLVPSPKTGDNISYMGFAGLDTEDIAVLITDAQAAASRVGVRSNNGAYIYSQPFWNGTTTEQPLWQPTPAEGYDGIVSSQLTTYNRTANTNGNQLTRIPSMKYTCGYDAHHLRLPPGAITADAGTIGVQMEFPSEQYGGCSFFMGYVCVETLQPQLIASKTSNTETIGLDGTIDYTIVVKNKGGAPSRQNAATYLTDTLDLPLDFVPGSVRIYNKNGANITATTTHTITNQGQDNDEYLKVMLPVIAAANAQGVQQDSITITFSVSIEDLSRKDIWRTGCRRTLQNKATLYYDTADGLSLTGESNTENGCGGDVFANVYVDDINLDEMLQETHYFTVDLGSEVTNPGNENICDWVWETMRDSTATFVPGALTLAEAQGYVVTDMDGNPIAAGTKFDPTMLEQSFMATKDVSTDGYECLETFYVSFRIVKIPDMTVTTVDPLCPEGRTGQIKVELTDGGSGFAVRIVEVSAPNDVLYFSRTKENQISDTYNAAYFEPGTYDVMLEVQGVVAEDKTVRVTLDKPSDASTLITPASACITTTNANLGVVCANTAFTLNQTKSNGAAYTTYQWKQSTDGGVNWINIPAGTQQNLTVPGGISENTIFKVYACNSQCQISDEYQLILTTVPEIADKTVEICSGETFTVDPAALAEAGDVIPVGTTYTWTVNSADVTGESTQATKQSAISQQLTNTTSPSRNAEVVYTVTPWIVDCAGETFEVKVTVKAIPTVATIPAQTICPEESTTDVTLEMLPALQLTDTHLFEWVIARTNGVTGGANDSGDVIPATVFTGSTPNVTLGGVVTYTITPTLNGCEGTDRTFTVNVKPTPTTNPVTVQTICSGESFVTVPLVSTPAGAGFTWTVLEDGVTGASDNATPATSIPATALTLVAGRTTQGSVVYTVTPALNSCVGTTGTFTVNINPIPEAPTSTGYEGCPTQTSEPTTWISLVNGIDPTATVKWYAAASGGAAIAIPANFDKAVQLTQSYWVTQTIDNCESTPRTEVKVKISLDAFPAPVNDYEACAISATEAVTTKTWASQLTLDPATDEINEWFNDNAGVVGTSLGKSEPTAFDLTTPGVHKYWVTILRNGCESEPGLITVTVKKRPTAVLSTDDDILCDGETATLKITFTGTAPFSYVYTDGITPSGTLSSATATATIPGLTPDDGTTYSLVSLSDALCAAIPEEDLNGEPQFTVYGPFMAGEIADDGQTLCANAITGITAIGSETAASGGDGNIIYEWRKSINGAAATSIAGSNAPAYTPLAAELANAGTTSVTITYTRWAKDGTCNTAFEQSAGEWTVTVNPTPTVNTIQDQELCANVVTAPINFTGNITTGVDYNWTNTNEDIGLAASGTGDIAAFTATNTTTALISGVIRVTPTAAGCVGDYKEFTISVKPIPSVDAPADQIFCAGATTAAITLTSANGVTGTTYNWTNSNTAIGLAASGSNTIPVFTTVNAGTANAVATIEVTPVAGGCTGTAETFTITVYPAFNAGAIESAGETLCDDETIAEIGSSPDASGGNGTIEYQWIKDGDTANPIANDAATYKPTEEGTYTRQVRQTGADACQTAWVTSGGSWKLEIRSGVDTGAIVAGTATVCHNSTAPVLTVGNTTTASGGDGTITYEWRKSVAGAAATSIAGSDSEDYIIPNADRINTGTANLEIVYTRWAKDGSCAGFAQSNGEFTLTVYPVFDAGAIATGTQTLCANETINAIGSTTPASGGGNNIEYRWFKDANTTPIAGATDATYTPVEAGVYRREARDGTTTDCADWTQSTGSWTVVINKRPSVTNQALTHLLVCSGEMSSALALTADVPGTTFAWVVSSKEDVIVAETLSGTGNIPALTLSTLSAGTDELYFDITPTANGCAGTPVRYTIPVRVCSDLVLKYTLSPEEICIGATTTLTLQVENRAALAANDVTVQIDLPAELSYVSQSGTGAFDDATNIWTVGTIQAGATAQITLEIKGEADDSGDIQAYIAYANGGNINNPSYAAVTEDDQKDDIEFTVRPLPTAAISGITTICNGNDTGNAIEVSFTGTAPFTFIYNDGTVDSAPVTTNDNPYILKLSPTTTTTATFTYTLKSVSDDNGCDALGTDITGQAQVTVTNAPAIPNITPPAAVCEDDKLTLVAPTPIAWNGDTTVQNEGWEINASGSWLPFDPAATPMVASTHNAKQLRYRAENGCAVSYSNVVDITVNVRPTATISGAATICAGGSTNLTVTFTGTAPFEFVYSADATPITVNGTSTTISVSPQTTTTYTLVSLSDANCTAAATGALTGSVEIKVDGTAPSGTAPSGATNINACFVDATTMPAGVAPFDVTAVAAQYTDDFGGAVTVTLTDTTVTGDDCSWTGIYTYSVEDTCGNTLSNQTITYTGGDTTAPALSGTAPVGTTGTQACFVDASTMPAGIPGFNNAAVAAEYSDACGTVSITNVRTTVTGNSCSWTGIYTYDVEDACGNTLADQTIVYTGGDTTAPVLSGTVPAGQTNIDACFVNATTMPSNVPVFDNAAVAAAYSDACGTVNITNVRTAVTGNSCSWTGTYTYDVEDACGNKLADQTIVHTGGDTTAPALSGIAPAGTTGTNACFVDATTMPSGVSPLDNTAVAAAYFDACGTVSITNVRVSVTGNNCSWTGTYTYDVEDACGNKLTDQTIVHTGGDTAAPALIGAAPAGTTGTQACFVDAATMPAGVPVFDNTVVAAAYSDACGTVTVSNVRTTVTGNNCAWTGTYTYDVEDACGNKLADQTIVHTGGDTTAPVFTLSATTAIAPGACTFTVPDLSSLVSTQSDNCTPEAGLVYAQSPAAGTPITADTQVSVTIADACGNMSAAQVVTVTVTPDTVAPVISGMVAAQEADNSNDCIFRIIDVRELVRAVSNDNCTPQASLVITQIPAINTPITETTTVTVTVTDASGNSSQTTVEIYLPAMPDIDFPAIAPLCANDAPVTLNASNTGSFPGTYSGIGVTGTTFDPASAGSGTHTVTYTIAPYGCVMTATQNVVVNRIPVITNVVAPSVCPEQPLAFDAVPNTYASYQWTIDGVLTTETGSKFVYDKPKTSGQTINISVVAVSDQGCQSIPFVAQTEVKIIPFIQLNPQPIYCVAKEGTKINWMHLVTASDNQVRWFETEDSQTPFLPAFIDQSVAGINTAYAMAISNNGCLSSERVKVSLTVHENPVLDRIDTSDLDNIKAFVSGGEAPYTYHIEGMSGGTDGEIHLGALSIGKHNLFVIDQKGCQLDEVIPMLKVRMIPDPYFSPNGDGQGNDRWYITNIERYVDDDVTIQIFDRTGKELAYYTAHDFIAARGWDGKFNGRSLPSTDYWYMIKVGKLDNESMTGHFTLKR